MDRTDVANKFPSIPKLSETAEADLIARQVEREEEQRRNAQLHALGKIIPTLQRMLHSAQAQLELLSVSNASPEPAAIVGYSKSLSSGIRKLESCFLESCDTQAGNPFLSAPGLLDTSCKAPEDIQILTSVDAVIIRLPYLPGRGYSPRSMIFHLLDARLRQCPNFPKWPKWSAAFYHVYSTTGSYTPRDVDNYDIKKAIDLIAQRLSATDDPQHFHITAMQTFFTNDIPSGTYIQIKPKSSENSEFEKLASFVASYERTEKDCEHPEKGL